MNSEFVKSEGSVKKYSFVNPTGKTSERENFIRVCGIDISLTSIANQSVTRWFCSGCGSQLYGQSSARPERMSVSAGNFEEFTKWPIAVESKCKRCTVDATDRIDKTHSVFTKDRWPGVLPIPGAIQTEDGNLNLNELLKGQHSPSTESKPVAE